MARRVIFITHPDVVIDPAVPVTDWPLSARGRARMAAAARLPVLAGVGAVWCSAERKARDGAAILGGALAMPVRVMAELGENDRSATGYLPRAEFEAVADLFFAHPAQSVRGWERAEDAQARIARAVADVAASAERVAVVSHGGVGALLLCRLLGERIDRTRDQPGDSGGNFFVFDPGTGQVMQGWQAIDGVPG